MSGQAWRLPPAAGSIAGAGLRFTFDGRALRGLAGDTLASALLANGVHLVGRSFKYHRPRGILTAGAEEPNALVQLERGTVPQRPEPAGDRRSSCSTACVAHQPEPLALACDFDVGARRRPAVAAAAGRLLLQDLHVAGARGWNRVYEPRIREAAGLGRRPTGPIPTATCTAMPIATCWWSAAARPG